MTDDWSDEQWDAASAAIRAAADVILVDGPLMLDELTVMLAERGALAEFDGYELDELEEIVDSALIETDDTWISDGGTVCLVRELLRGVVLTHRVTASELERGVLDSTPDLGAITWGAERSWVSVGGEVTHEYPFHDEPHVAEHGSYVGSAGWLDGIEPGELIGATCDGERFDIVRDVTPDLAESVVELVRSVFDEVCDDGSAVESDRLILESLIRDPRVFRTPTAPFAELIEQAGLRLEGAWIGRADRDFTIPGARFQEQRLERLSAEYQLDTCCRAALERLMAIWSKFVLTLPEDRSEVAKTWEPRVLRDDFHHGAATPALVDSIWYQHEHRVGLLDDFATMLSGFGELESAALYLRAYNALRGGAAGEALDSIQRSTTLDGEFSPALQLHATLLADAGRPADALSAQRRALEFGGSKHEVSFLTDLLRRFTDAGRNDPCPCGSGRKYKQCCQREPKLSVIDRRRLVLHQATESLREHHRRDLSFGLAMAAFEESGAPISEMPEVVTRFITDPFVVDLALFDGGGIDDYVYERQEIIPQPELVWLQSVSESRRTLWEYRRVDSDSLELRDVLNGNTVRSIKSDGGAFTDQGYLLARIVDDAVDGTIGLLGPSYEISLRQRAGLIEMLDADADEHELAAWYGAQTAPPTLQNREGDSLSLSNAYFTPAPGHEWQSIEASLDELYERDENGWTEFLDLGDERIVRVAMWRSGDELVVSTNSVARFKRARDALVGLGLDFQRLEEPNPSELHLDEPFPDAPEIPEADLDHIREQNEDRWLSEHVPAFDGLTPPQAVDDPTRRDDVIKLIDSFERHPVIGFAPYDFNRLRAKLGLPPPMRSIPPSD